MVYTPWLAGEKIAAAKLGGLSMSALKTTNYTHPQSNTTLANIPEMVIPVAANAIYAYEASYIYSSAANADIKLNLTLPAGSTFDQSAWCAGTGATGASNAVFHDVITSSQFSAGGIGVGTRMSCRPTGRLIVAGTAGNVQLQAAQDTSQASNTVLHGGSWFRLTRIG